MTNPNLLLVYPENIKHVWEEVDPLIEKALEHSAGGMDVTDALKLLLEEDLELWVGVDEDSEDILCALLTEIVAYPNKTVLRILTFATESGLDLDLWMECLPVLEAFAVHMKCDALEAWTRKGLAKKLNWEHEYSIITKTIAI